MSNLKTILLLGILITTSLAASAQVITSVSIEGPSNNPTVIVSGFGLGTEPAGSPPPYGLSGLDFPAGTLSIIDQATTHQAWSAGSVATTIGLIVLNYSDTQIIFQFGSALTDPSTYSSLYTMQQGDPFIVGVNGLSFSGTVNFVSGETIYNAPPYSFTTLIAPAPLNSPRGVAVAGNGNIYVADFVNDTIQDITPAGVVLTIAGTPGMTGFANGIGPAAKFNDPYGLAVDSGGNVYVADSGNNMIRKITPGGRVTTLAGAPGMSGYTNGIGSAALFNFPTGVAVDGGGNVYVADSGNNMIRKITPGGRVTTLAGTPNGGAGHADGTGTAAQFFSPGGVAVDSSGSNVYVADTDNCTIRQITSGGQVTTLAGTPGMGGSADGTGPAVQFDFPLGVAVDGSGNVYVADEGNCTIRKITSGGLVTTLAGTPAVGGLKNGTGSAAQFADPLGVAVDGSGNVYVCDTGNDRIREGLQDIPLSSLSTIPVTVDQSVALDTTDNNGDNLYYAGSGPASISGANFNIVTFNGVGSVDVEIISAQEFDKLFNETGGIHQNINPVNPNQPPSDENGDQGGNSGQQGSQSIIFPAIGNQTYGAIPITLAAVASSGQPVTYSTIGPVKVSGNTLTITGVGSAVIGAHQTGNANYTAAPEARQVITISKAPQTITFSPVSNKTFGTGPFHVAATASSGLPITYSVASGPATLVSNLVTITGAGTVVLAANQTGNADYNPATEATTSFTVAQAKQTITFPAIGNQLYPSAPITLKATSTSGLAVAYRSSGPAKISGNTLTITGVGSVLVGAYVNATTNYAAAQEVRQTFTVSAAP